MPTEQLFTYTLTAEDEKRKIQEILLRRFHFSHKVLQGIKQGENAWLDGEFVRLNTRGKAGQTLVVNVGPKEYSNLPAEAAPLDILYEDEILLAVNKPAGQVVHPTGGYLSGTLANAVTGYWENSGQSRPFRSIFRIDRNTSGIVLIAKSRFAHQQMAWLSARNLVNKNYFGFVQGIFPLEKGEFSSSIRLKEGSGIIRQTHPAGKPALTRFRTLRRFGSYTMLEFTLITGRTHQIRAHCQGAGYPLLGDELYGGDLTLISRQALHCFAYTFCHPVNGREIRITAPLPEDLRILLRGIRQNPGNIPDPALP